MYRLLIQSGIALRHYCHLLILVLVMPCLIFCHNVAIARETASTPLDGAGMLAIYQQIMRYYATGQTAEAYRLARRHLDLEHYPPELLVITIELSYQFGDYSLAGLTSAHFEKLFPSHPDRPVVSAISAYYQGRCTDIDTGLANYAPTRAHRHRQQIINYYKIKCAQKSWSHYMRFGMSSERTILAGEPARQTAIRSHPQSQLGIICQIFYSPSCLDDGHVLLPANTKPKRILHSDMSYHVRMAPQARSVVWFGLSQRLSSTSSTALQMVEPAGSFSFSYQFSDRLTCDLFTELRSVTYRPFASRQLNFMQAQSAFGMQYSYPAYRFLPLYRLSLSHNHLYGNQAPYHESAVTNSIQLSVTPYLRLTLQQKHSHLSASTNTTYGDIKSIMDTIHISYTPHPERTVKTLVSGLGFTEASLEFGIHIHQASRTAPWLVRPHLQREQNLEMKTTFEHFNLGINFYSGLSLTSSKSENSLLDYSYSTVLFGLTKQFPAKGYP